MAEKEGKKKTSVIKKKAHPVNGQAGCKKLPFVDRKKTTPP
jgi:hypothetical protein